MEKNILYGIISGLVVFLVLGIPTALIPTTIFLRQIPANFFDYIFLFATSSLIGVYVSLSFSNKKQDRSAYGILSGTVASLFAFGCPICNALLVSLFGSTALLVYFEPFRPILGAISIAILSLMVYIKMRSNRCKTCK